MLEKARRQAEDSLGRVGEAHVVVLVAVLVADLAGALPDFPAGDDRAPAHLRRRHAMPLRTSVGGSSNEQVLKASECVLQRRTHLSSAGSRRSLAGGHCS